jgi:plastocyanin
VTRASARRPLRLAAVAAAALALVAAGCGESREQASSTATTAAPAPTTAPATPTPQPADLSVTEREYSLSPSKLRVPKPGTFKVAIRNTGAIPHALEVEGPRGEVRTGAIGPGQTAQLQLGLRKPGRYVWYCPIGDHRKRGMRGAVVVGG